MISAEEQLTRNNPVADEVIHTCAWLLAKLFLVITLEASMTLKTSIKALP